MTGTTTRDAWDTGLTCTPRHLKAAGAVSPEKTAEKTNLLDIHIHLFGVGDSGSGCHIAKRSQEGLLFKLLSTMLGLKRRAKTLDQAYEQVLAERLEASELDRGVILAQDAVYNQAGKPDWEKTTFYVPNEYLFQVVAKYPQWMVPCVSINPNRADALEELGRCLQRGARILKIHPPTQNVDLADKRHIGFFRRCAENNVLVLVHTGHEHAAPVFDVELARPGKLRLALEQGCRVVACHCGTGWPGDRPDMLPEFLELLRHYENLWGDTSILGIPWHARDFRRLLKDETAKNRLLHGSDFPFPAVPLAFARSIGVRKALLLQAMRNQIQQDFLLKEAMKIGRESAERAYRLVLGATAGLSSSAARINGPALLDKPAVAQQFILWNHT